jgi:hypothetical protein
MAYPATPKTWVAGDVLTAAQMNAELRDALLAAFPLSVNAWTTYTPTLTQSGAVTKTVTYGKYQRVGRMITAAVLLSCTGAGTAANAILAGLPVTAATPANVAIGSGWILDASTSNLYKAVIEVNSSTTVLFRPTSTVNNDKLGEAVMTAALAAGDLITFTATYESAA